jgi:hypothetical protein
MRTLEDRQCPGNQYITTYVGQRKKKEEKEHSLSFLPTGSIFMDDAEESW